MASFAKKFNKERLFNVDTSEFTYCSFEDLYEEFGPEQIYIIRGIYINTKGNYGESLTIALDDRYVNAPSNLTDTGKEMLKDPEAIRSINAGAAGFTIYPYMAHGKTVYGATWVDIPRK